ncbi:50S ribosomal protein L10 [[Mycoplasma] testudinis]|uniref:50S ribosomal protein L10 n=1 Tax=[Mycoplasma] testudinis TaxID=33924 RepID=UPI000485DDCB|nr:50S ribosomal protein L10 [[Mycoplasma] testudinis]
MKAVIQNKIDRINEVGAVISQAKSFVVFQYSTMTAHEASAIRRELHQAGNKMFILKNNILRRAIAQANITVPDNLLVGQVAIAFGINDAFQPIKAVFKITKDRDHIKFKFGYLEQKVIDVNELNQIASLPSREELYSMFLSVLQAPLRKLMYAMKSVGEKK